MRYLAIATVVSMYWSSVGLAQGNIVVFEDRTFVLETEAFTEDGVICSTFSTAGDSDQPGGLFALATFPGVPASNILLFFDCVRGPDGPQDCEDVEFTTSVVFNQSGALGTYKLAPSTLSTSVLTPEGKLESVGSTVKPGPWVFSVLATDGIQMARERATYTILPEMEIISRPKSSSGFISSFYFNTNTSDSAFPSSTLLVNFESGIQGIVLQSGQVTNRTVKPGSTHRVPFDVLAVSGGVLEFYITDISGDTIGIPMLVDEVAIRGTSMLQTVVPHIVAPDEPGTYIVEIGWDSSVSVLADQAPTLSDFMLHVQPELGPIVDMNSDIGAISSKQSSSVLYHGSVFDPVQSSFKGTLAAMADLNGDGVDELITIRCNSTDILHQSILYLTPDPLDDLTVNFQSNRGRNINFFDTTAFTLVAMDIDGALEQQDADEGLSMTVGDLDGDGNPDLVVSTDYNSGDFDESTGAVFVFYHREAESLDTVLYGEDPYDEDDLDAINAVIKRTPDANNQPNRDGWLFGYSCAIGNVEGGPGSANELIIGAPREESDGDNDSGSGTSPGQVYVLDPGLNTYFEDTIITQSNQSTGIVSSRILGSANDEYFGAGLAVGDLNNDGIDDIVIGAPGADSNAGQILVVNGTLGLLPSQVNSADRTYDGRVGDGWGRRIAIGQFNASGPLDIAASGTATASGMLSADGVVHLIYDLPASDAVDQLGVGEVTTFEGGSNQNLGWRFGVGDFNDDDIDDLLFYAAGDSHNIKAAVNLFLGTANPPSVGLPTSTLTNSIGLGFDDVQLPVDGGGLNARDLTEGFVNNPGAFIGILDINTDGVPDLVVVDISGPQNLRFVAGAAGSD